MQILKNSAKVKCNLKMSSQTRPKETVESAVIGWGSSLLNLP